MLVSICKKVLRTHWLLTIGLLISIVGSILLAVIPPLILAKMMDTLALHQVLSVTLIVVYFIFYLAENLCISLRDTLMVAFGQKISHALRSAMMQFYTTLDTDTLNQQAPGSVVSRFLNDVDALEDLFTSGVLSLFVDACTLVSILVVVFQKAFGAFLLLVIVLPFLFRFTRFVQKSMLKNEIDNRNAIAKTNAILPETVQNLLTIQNLKVQAFMEKRYGKAIQDSYEALQKTNFFDAIYSPVVLILNALVIGLLVLLCVDPKLDLSLFGMSVGTAVMSMQYISKVFEPIESIGMEIQVIQSSMASIHRIHDFFQLPVEDVTYKAETETTDPIISIQNLSFAYPGGKEIFHDFSLTIQAGEQVTLQGRTGVGKSTLFKLILGLYTPKKGSVRIFHQNPSTLLPSQRRELLGYVEQSFHPVKGTIKEQITLFDDSISLSEVQKACQIVGLWESIEALPEKLDSPFQLEILSQGQWQLLSIARAIVKDPPLLLLDEITASLDRSTEQAVLTAMEKAMKDRTVLSISHRTSAITGKVIEIQG